MIDSDSFINAGWGTIDKPQGKKTTQVIINYIKIPELNNFFLIFTPLSPWGTNIYPLLKGTFKSMMFRTSPGGI